MTTDTPGQAGMNAKSHTLRQAGTMLIAPLRPHARRLRAAAESMFATGIEVKVESRVMAA